MSVLIIWLILFALVILFFAGATIQNKMIDDVEDEYNELKHHQRSAIYLYLNTGFTICPDSTVILKSIP